MTTLLSLFQCRATIPPTEHVNAIVMGNRYTGPEARDAGIVHEIAPESELMTRALAKGEQYADIEYSDKSLQQLKNDMHYYVNKALLGGAIYFSEL